MPVEGYNKNMNQRRILIGSMIGILTFTLLSWVSPKTWNVLEGQLLQGRSHLRFYNPFAKVKYLVLEFDNPTSSEFGSDTLSQKELLMNVVSELAARNAKSITIAINKFNPLQIDNLDLEAAIGSFDSHARTLKVNDIETELKSGNSILWLDRKQHNLKRYAIEDLLNDVIPSESIEKQNIIIISPQLELNDEDLNLLVNHLSDRWVTYLPMPTVFKFLLFVGAGIFLAALVYWARIVSFFAVCLVCMLIGQLTLTFFNVHIETVSFMISVICILLITNLFDLNLMAAISRRNFFQSKQDDKSPDLNSPEVIMTTPFIQVGSAAANVDPQTVKELRAKFFHEQESNFEDIALEFQEKTIRSVNAVTEKLEELNESEQLTERDRTKLSLLKHNFDHLIEEIDSILFNLVPFRFETDKGLIGLVELYASKLFLLSKGKLQISIETEFPSLKLELDQKINCYRIIQRLIELIKSANEGKSTGVISINIHSTKEGKLRCRVSYEGKAVDANTNNFKINEIYKRIAGLNDGQIDFGSSALSGIANLTNHIEFEFRTGAIKIKARKEQALAVN